MPDPHPAHPASLSPVHGLRILVVPGAVGASQPLAAWLAEAGAEVETADAGDEAVERTLARAKDGTGFEVVLFDFDAPVLDVCQAARALRSFGWPGLLLALIDSPTPGDCETCLYAGCDDLLYKPVAPATLGATLARHRAAAAGRSF